MINKDRIQKVDIYGEGMKHLFSTKAFTFPKDFFKIKGWELVSIKQANLPIMRKGDVVSAVFEYSNGTRVRCDTKVDISTSEQMNFHVDDGYVLEERRNSFKVATPNEYAKICRIEHIDDTVTDLEEPFRVRIHNINLTGVFMESSTELQAGEIVGLLMFDETVELRTEILRVQKDNDGGIIGYGCKFHDVTPAIEEKIARFIFNLQVQERERRNIR